jgi:hypothetical protein
VDDFLMTQSAAHPQSPARPTHTLPLRVLMCLATVAATGLPLLYATRGK